MAEVIITPESAAPGMKVIDLGFPQNVRIALIKRDGKYLIPDGETVIKFEDRLILIAGNKDILSNITGRLTSDRPPVE